jgi:hypothetical protein
LIEKNFQASKNLQAALHFDDRNYYPARLFLLVLLKTCEETRFIQRISEKICWMFYKGVGERGRNRTFNLLIKSQLLCQLSYAPG